MVNVYRGTRSIERGITMPAKIPTKKEAVDYAEAILTYLGVIITPDDRIRFLRIATEVEAAAKEVIR